METTWQEWMEIIEKSTKIKVKRRKLTDISPWKVLKWCIKRIDGMFFRVSGFFVEKIDGTKVFSWNQILLETEDPIHGWLILVVAEEDNVPYFLLTARAEPGWKKIGLGPTFQASKSNLSKNPNLPRKELIEEAEKDVILQDGGIYYDKSNYSGILVFKNRKDFEDRFGMNGNERWFSADEFREALKAGLVSDHLLQPKAYYHSVKI